MVNEEGTDVITYNELNESMIYKDELPNFPLEYSPNKLLVTGSDTHMYQVDDWSTVRLISGTNPLDINKFHAFTIPQYDEESFPFIFVVGEQHISLLNTTTLEHKALTTGLISSA